jgi:hypothetical protein
VPWMAPEPMPELVTEPAQVFAPPVAPVAPSQPANGSNGSVAARQSNGGNGANTTKLKIEALRLEGLVKKLQAELQAEREYSHALEAHIKTLQETD